MSECVFEFDEVNIRCTVCGWTRPHRGRIHSWHRDCPGTAESPSLLTRAANLTGAIARHTANGFKTRTEDEAAAILSICKACEHYDSEKEACRKCGCKATARGLVDKIRWASEHCPLKPPKW